MTKPLTLIIMPSPPENETPAEGNYYCSPEDVSSVLRLTTQDSSLQTVRLTFSETTDPTRAEVLDWIQDSEAEIEQRTGKSFAKLTRHVEHRKLGVSPRPTGGDMSLNLDRTDIAPFDPAQGDRVEFWTRPGDYIDKSTEHGWRITEDGKFILESAYLPTFFAPIRIYPPQIRVRLTYRYGTDDVPRDVKRACALLTATRIIESDFYRKALPNLMGESISPMSVMDSHRKEVDRILARYRGIEVLGL